MTLRPRTIAIVGGGCSGTLAAVQLLRSRPRVSTRIVLIERSGVFGRGIAFARHPFPYLLNVPASRMSASATAPDEFLEFARRRDPAVSPHDFLPRSLYGEYLQQLLDAAARSAGPHVQLVAMHAEVVALAVGAAAAPLVLTLLAEPALEADAVVLATGHSRPRRWPELAAVAGHPAVVTNPWSCMRDYRPHERVLVLGSGLTMADVVSAALSAEPTVRLWSLSRHGLVPRVQSEPRPDFPAAATAIAQLESARSARQLLRATRRIAADAAGCGGDWREAVQLARQEAPTLWRRLPVGERRRFLRHLRSFWDVHRHRLPPSIAERLDRAIGDGTLTVSAGRLRGCTAEGAQLSVRWRARGASEDRSERFDRIIVATGPDAGLAEGAEPLWQSLLGSGIAVTDELALGIRTGANGALLDRGGRASTRIFYAGPLLRADHWEATAVHELRTHIEALARQLADPAGSR